VGFPDFEAHMEDRFAMRQVASGCDRPASATTAPSP
jgi:hypothetical protein